MTMRFLSGFFRQHDSHLSRHAQSTDAPDRATVGLYLEMARFEPLTAKMT